MIPAVNWRGKLLPILVVVILIFDVALPLASAHGTYRTSEMGGSLVCDTTALGGSSDSFTQTGFTNGTRHYYITFANDAVPRYSSAVASAQGSATPAAVAPGDILINEVAFKEDNDWIEFYVLKAANYEGLTIYHKGGSGVKEFPKITASAGDYIVLHFDGDPANDENAATRKGSNGYWDIYTGDTGLTGTDNVVRIQRVGTESVREADTIDAVIWSDNSAKFTASQAVANALVAPGHWDAGAVFSGIRDSDAWTDSDDVKAGKSIGRDASSTDTNGKTDWYVFTSQSPGEANPTLGVPGSVLINEVAPSETGGYDWIEFYNGSGSSVDIQYWVVEEQTTGIKTFSSYFMAPGEYVVLNLNRDLPDEIMSDVNGNGHRDFYSDDEGLTRTDNAIILEDGASTIIHALAFANNDGTWASDQQTAFNNTVNAGHWEGTLDGGAGVNEAESADWSQGDESRSLGRDSASADTNRKADWYLLDYQSPGEVNRFVSARVGTHVQLPCIRNDDGWSTWI